MDSEEIDNTSSIIKESLILLVSEIKKAAQELYDLDREEFNRYYTDHLFQSLEYFQRSGDIYNYGFISTSSGPKIITTIRILPFANNELYFDYMFIL